MMKTIIVYGTKYGTTTKAVKELQKHLQGEVTAVNIVKESAPDLKVFDKVIVGGSIYVGQIQKEVTAFITEQRQTLLTNPLGLFICAGSDETTLHSVFEESLRAHANSAENFGGELDTTKMNWIERLICRLIAKTNAKNNKPQPKLHIEKIEVFGRKMNES